MRCAIPHELSEGGLPKCDKATHSPLSCVTATKRPGMLCERSKMPLEAAFCDGDKTSVICTTRPSEGLAQILRSFGCPSGWSLSWSSGSRYREKLGERVIWQLWNSPLRKR